ncbi:hypothetical protein [Hydrogenophaga sp.]|uniref:hypothetical protein n=2 Tax=unclassified Hydrogenophaga TaxID=2610897 RepID=UPI000A2E977E|nr:hypothetical protein CAP37_20265 [Hydrogenophaga sp. IBVHS1]
MQHYFSNEYIQQKYPPPSKWPGRALRLVVAGIVGLVATLLFVSSMDHDFDSLFPLAYIATIIAIVAYAFLWVFRLFWLEGLYRTAVFEIDQQGVWRKSKRGAELLIEKRQLFSIGVYRRSSREVAKLVLVGRKRSVEVEGLVSMDAFLDDLTRAYPTVPVFNA